MAKLLIETLTDDLDGSTAQGTVAFSVGGTDYEIELSKKNRAAFDKALSPYVGAARKVRAATPASTSRRARDRRTDLAEIRAWARAQGYEVSARGRIAAEIVDAYGASR